MTPRLQQLVIALLTDRLRRVAPTVAAGLAVVLVLAVVVWATGDEAYRSMGGP